MQYRLHRTNALAIELASLWGVNRLAHTLTGVGGVFELGHKTGDLAAASVIGLEWAFETLLAQWACSAVHCFGGIRLIVQTPGADADSA